MCVLLWMLSNVTTFTHTSFMKDEKGLPLKLSGDPHLGLTPDPLSERTGET